MVPRTARMTSTPTGTLLAEASISHSASWTAATPDTSFSPSRVADTLLQLSHWRGAVRDLGECEVKHGLRLRIFNLSTPEFGNTAIPSRLRQAGNGGGPLLRLDRERESFYEVVTCINLEPVCPTGKPAFGFDSEKEP